MGSMLPFQSGMLISNACCCIHKPLACDAWQDSPYIMLCVIIPFFILLKPEQQQDQKILEMTDAAAAGAAAAAIAIAIAMHAHACNIDVGCGCCRSCHDCCCCEG